AGRGLRGDAGGGTADLRARRAHRGAPWAAGARGAGRAGAAGGGISVRVLLSSQSSRAISTVVIPAERSLDRESRNPVSTGVCVVREPREDQFVSVVTGSRQSASQTRVNALLPASPQAGSLGRDDER